MPNMPWRQRRGRFHLPENCSFDVAGALPTAGLTAYQMLINRARVRPGEDVLVIAAGSGVGSYASLKCQGRGRQSHGHGRDGRQAPESARDWG